LTKAAKCRYRIATTGGIERCTGWVLGILGARRGPAGWEVTHLPTGVCVAVYPNKATAMDELEALHHHGLPWWWEEWLSKCKRLPSEEP